MLARSANAWINVVKSFASRCSSRRSSGSVKLPLGLGVVVRGEVVLTARMELYLSVGAAGRKTSVSVPFWFGNISRTVEGLNL